MTMHYIFWRSFVVALFLTAGLAVGGLATIFAMLVRRTLGVDIHEKVMSYTNIVPIGDRLDVWFYDFLGACIHLYVKVAQWVGSIVLVLYIVSLVAYTIAFTSHHWKEIWG